MFYYSVQGIRIEASWTDTTNHHKPCPFCGNIGDQLGTLTCVAKDSLRSVHYVQCGACHACGPESDWWQGAWETWDRLAALDALTREVEKFKSLSVPLGEGQAAPDGSDERSE